MTFYRLSLSTTLNTCFIRPIKEKNQSTCIAPCMVQTTLKRSGMDHTAFNLQRTQCLPLSRKRSPDGASTECGGEHLIAAHYSFIDPRWRKAELAWLVDLYGRITHISGHPSATGRAQYGERTLARDWRSIAEPRRPISVSVWFKRSKTHWMLVVMATK